MVRTTTRVTRRVAKSALTRREELTRQLRERLVGRPLVLGVGNRLRGDDAVGSIVAKRLRAFEPSTAIDGGVAPENHLRAIQRAEPGTVYVVDALDSGETPGHITVFSFEDLPAGGISTHAVSLAVLREYLAMEGLRNIQLVGVQPGSLRMGRTLSRAVREAARTLVAAFEELIEPPPGP